MAAITNSDSQDLLFELSIGQYQAITKILSWVPIKTSKQIGPLAVNINDSTLSFVYPSGEAFATCDLSNIVDQNVNMSFILNKESMNRLAGIRGGDSVLAFADHGRGYALGNGHTWVNLVRALYNPTPLPPEGEAIGNATKLIDLYDIKRFIGKTGHAMLLIYDNQIEGVELPSGDVFFFDRMFGVEARGKAPDITFNVSHLLQLQIRARDARDASLRLLKKNNSIYLHTQVLVNDETYLNIYEQLN